MDQGRSGFPYSWRMALVMIVYLSSESIKSPSMSKMQARTRGKLACQS